MFKLDEEYDHTSLYALIVQNIYTEIFLFFYEMQPSRPIISVNSNSIYFGWLVPRVQFSSVCVKGIHHEGDMAIQEYRIRITLNITSIKNN